MRAAAQLPASRETDEKEPVMANQNQDQNEKRRQGQQQQNHPGGGQRQQEQQGGGKHQQGGAGTERDANRDKERRDEHR